MLEQNKEEHKEKHSGTDLLGLFAIFTTSAASSKFFQEPHASVESVPGWSVSSGAVVDPLGQRGRRRGRERGGGWLRKNNVK